MDRRDFVSALWKFSCLGASSLFIAEHLKADLKCTPYNQAGVQQCQAGIDSTLVNISAIDDEQHQSEWCWAASISMVFQYYGCPVSQSRIVKETWGQVVNVPAGPDQILSDLNRPWKDEDGKKFTVSGESYDANPGTAAQDLAQDMPLIIGTMGHAMVLTALTYLRDAAGRGDVQEAIVRDPWPGKGRRVLTPREWYATNFLARIRVEKDDDE